MKKLLVSIIATLSMLTCSFYYANAIEKNDSEIKNLYKEESQVVTVFNAKGKDIYITNDDIHLMAQIVYAESCAEPYEGKVAVASVILNRVKDKGFPDNVEDVIKQRAAFSCVKNGEIDVKPDEYSFRAVMDALRGKDPTGNAVFFYNPKIATCSWMKNIAKKNNKRIGNHVFFVVN